MLINILSVNTIESTAVQIYQHLRHIFSALKSHLRDRKLDQGTGSALTEKILDEGMYIHED